jgi:hypothetical protein
MELKGNHENWRWDEGDECWVCYVPLKLYPRNDGRFVSSIGGMLGTDAHGAFHEAEYALFLALYGRDRLQGIQKYTFADNPVSTESRRKTLELLTTMQTVGGPMSLTLKSKIDEAIGYLRETSANDNG